MVLSAVHKIPLPIPLPKVKCPGKEASTATGYFCLHCVGNLVQVVGCLHVNVCILFTLCWKSLSWLFTYTRCIPCEYCLHYVGNLVVGCLQLQNYVKLIAECSSQEFMLDNHPSAREGEARGQGVVINHKSHGYRAVSIIITRQGKYLHGQA